MREILFRGKDNSGVLNHIWCFGSLDTTLNEQPTIIYPDRFGNRCKIIVKEHTIGQYTGLTDKNGKKIFEGDIVHCISRMDSANMVVIFEQGEFRMVLADKYKDYIEGCGFYAISCFTKEVIGNIHDNPELLERGVNDER